MNCRLSILIPTMPNRKESYDALYACLMEQWENSDFEIVFDDDPTNSIGAKRNNLLSLSEGEYVAFIDDDDMISKEYIKHAMEGINKGVDCVSLRGVITWDGDRPEIFEHSIKYPAYVTNDTGVPKYERYPNHLNCIKASIAKQFKFPEINHGEDTDWATQIKESGLIKTEHYVDAVTYHYQFKTKK